MSTLAPLQFLFMRFKFIQHRVPFCCVPRNSFCTEHAADEGGDNMISSAHPARYADGLEEVLVATVRSLAVSTPAAL